MYRSDESLLTIIESELLNALLSEVNPSLRGVAFDLNERELFVFITFYNDGKMSDALEDHYSYIDNEASCRFVYQEGLVRHDYKIVRLDYPAELPMHEHWVYKRREPFQDPED